MRTSAEVEVRTRVPSDAERRLIIVGAGGHAKVVADVALAAGYHILGFADDAADAPPLPGWTVLGPISRVARILHGAPGAQIIVAIGDNASRQRVVQYLTGQVHPSPRTTFATIIHPAATVSSYASVQPGSVIMPGAVVNAGTQVGSHAILNTSCSVDHDCVIGSFAHLSPGAHLAGGVKIEDGVHLGVGVSVIPLRHIGAWTLVGAGAAVVDDLPGGVVAYGVPAKVVRQLKG